jgi:hypothetical protein
MAPPVPKIRVPGRRHPNPAYLQGESPGPCRLLTAAWGFHISRAGRRAGTDDGRRAGTDDGRRAGTDDAAAKQRRRRRGDRPGPSPAARPARQGFVVASLRLGHRIKRRNNERFCSEQVKAHVTAELASRQTSDCSAVTAWPCCWTSALAFPAHDTPGRSGSGTATSGSAFAELTSPWARLPPPAGSSLKPTVCSNAAPGLGSLAKECGQPVGGMSSADAPTSCLIPAETYEPAGRPATARLVRALGASRPCSCARSLQLDLYIADALAPAQHGGTWATGPSCRC